MNILYVCMYISMYIWVHLCLYKSLCVCMWSKIRLCVRVCVFRFLTCSTYINATFIYFYSILLLFAFLIYVLQIESVSKRKTAPLMIINEPAASALRLRSLKRKFELSCHSSMIRAPEMTKRTQPKIEMSAFRRFSTIELSMCPKIKRKIVKKLSVQIICIYLIQN